MSGFGGRWSAVGTLSLLTFLMVIASSFITCFVLRAKEKASRE